MAGGALPAEVCQCDDSSYCQVVASGTLDVSGQALEATYSVAGDLSPLAFESLRNASAAELQCFQGGLGQATDTYIVRTIGVLAGHVFSSANGPCNMPLPAAVWPTEAGLS